MPHAKPPVSPMQKKAEALLILLWGGVCYYGIELLWRGYSHWSMAICGAICFLFLYRLNQRYPRVPLLLRAFCGGCFITLQELLFGCVFNIFLGMQIWDYREMPFQFLGQICLSYSLLWFLLCFPLSALTRWIRQKVFYEEG